jgi:hypothetical protein
MLRVGSGEPTREVGATRVDYRDQQVRGTFFIRLER